MSALQGIYLERLVVKGPGLADAVLEFKDGLNVIAGASDTGKSYAFSCIDYVFGAKRPPKKIKEAAGYQSVVLRVIARETSEHFELERSLAGGEVQLRKLGPRDEILDAKVLSATHAVENPQTISGQLLQWCGLWGRQIRTNKRGDQRSLSFRDVAFLVLVDENRMFEERPPHLSEIVQSHTAESDTLRLLVTGTESAPVIALPSKKLLASNKAKNELLAQMISTAEAEFGTYAVSDTELTNQIERLEKARNVALSDYDDSRRNTVVLEQKLADLARDLRDVQARALVIEGLQKRFELLRSHYESDLNRLRAIEETGILLESFPAKACPACGAAPHEHRPEACAVEYRIIDVQASARSESTKVETLKADLNMLLAELSTEASALEGKRRAIAHAMESMQSQITQELMPRIRQSAEELKVQTAVRDRLVQARSIADQLKQLRDLAATLQIKEAGELAPSEVEVTATTADLDAFAAEVGALLEEWHYPDLGRVVFSEDEQDIVIGAQIRTAHGKGVRALTCAAFILGLERHCQKRDLAHPRVVVLDSPLVAYEEADEGTPTPEDTRLHEAGVKEAFYTTLARGAVGGQIIIFENQDPPPEVSDGLHRQHFTRTNRGRYGFFPV